MFIDGVSGVSGSGSASLSQASAVTQVSASAQTAATTQASGQPTTAASAPKPVQPFLLVPTEPLSPTVLAELIGHQLSLNGPTVAEDRPGMSLVGQH
jgi:hypothetical protein